jgi:5-methylcytosine-specific restriction protein B
MQGRRRWWINLAERQQQFLGAIQKHFGTPKATRPSKLFGVSNSAKIVEGGIQIGVANLNCARENAEAFIFARVMKFPPEDEVYFAVLVRKKRLRHGRGLSKYRSIQYTESTAYMIIYRY